MTRAMASVIPEVIPAIAVRRTTLVIVRHLGMPSAAAKSSRDLVGDERAVRVAGVVAQGLCDVRDPGQS